MKYRFTYIYSRFTKYKCGQWYWYKGLYIARICYPVVCPLFTISKIISSETAQPVKAKLHVEHP